MYVIVRVLIGIIFLGCFVDVIRLTKLPDKRKLYAAFVGTALR